MPTTDAPDTALELMATADSDFILQPRFSVDVPNMADYFGVWAIYDNAFRSLVERWNGVDLHVHMASQAAREEVDRQNQRPFELTREGIAIIPVSGPMMKSVSSMSGGTSTIRLRQQIRSARKDNEVLGAMLVLDTPGGTVKGNRDLADEVAAFAAAKPIYAFTEDLTASAGVSVASQANKRFANNATALYGCMGTYSVLVDASGRAEQLGLKVHVIKTGAYKGMGEPGSEITAEQLVEAQRIVNALNEGYLELIARGLQKPIEMIRSLADGRVHTAADAQGMGLIDGVQAFEQTYEQLVAATRKSTWSGSRTNPKQSADSAATGGTGIISERKPAMSTENATEKVPATLAQLKSTFPNSTADWRESQMEAGASVLEASIAYSKHVETKAAEERTAHEKALKETEEKAEARIKTAGGSLGHDPLRARSRATDGEAEYEESGDAVEDFNAAVAKIAGKNPTMQRRQRVVRQVARANPQLYGAYLLATNDGSKKVSRLIEEKLESVGSDK